MLQPTETVSRPDPGLARGKWEAPAWAFWVALALVVVGTTLYVLRRMGFLRMKSAAKAVNAGSVDPGAVGKTTGPKSQR